MNAWNSYLEILEDARFKVYEDEREEIITSVSTCGLYGNQMKVHKGQMKCKTNADFPGQHQVDIC